MKIRQQTKKEQRIIVETRVKNLENKEEFSRKITEKVLALDEYKYAKSVMVYLSLPDEVNTEILLKDALKNKDLVCVPVTREEIHLITVNSKSRFIKGPYNVLEPEGGIEIADVELAIIPMVAFDKNCDRLGHGKGFFDKFLLDKKCFKVGLAFSVQEFEKLSVSPTDIKMDIVVTEKEIFYCK